MGLFVVGRLAAQHGVTVRLRRTAAGSGTPGITASVHVPGELVVTDRADGTGWPFRLTPAPRANGHLDLADTAVQSGDLPLDWPMPGPTPIFDRMASRWFAEAEASANREWAPAEVDAARLVAATAMEPMEPVEPNRAGLPIRVPGAHLAPGAAQERQQSLPDNGFRDPAAVRENLSRHYHGMRAARRKTNGAAVES